MISAKKIKTNRLNARASTGPKTAQGRTRAAQNAWRHGLSLSILADPVLSAEAEDLAVEIAGEGINPELLELARRIAEAQIDLQRVRYARHQFLSHRLDDPKYDPIANVRARQAAIRKFLRSNVLDTTAMAQFATTTPQSVDRFALILSQDVKHLLAMNRYEQRTLSRRKFAIRALDAARAETKMQGAHDRTRSAEA
jgi:hypothetical protein